MTPAARSAVLSVAVLAGCLLSYLLASSGRQVTADEKKSASASAPCRSLCLLALSPDGKQLYVPNYFSGAVAVLDAESGKLLFQGKAECADCHPTPHFTDKEMHNTGILTPNEPDGHYDTPSLIEAYRTGPYLHDGRARTLKEMLTTHNQKDLHGKTTALTAQEIDDLAAYLLSL